MDNLNSTENLFHLFDLIIGSMFTFFVLIVVAIGIKKYMDLVWEVLKSDELENNRRYLNRIIFNGEMDLHKKLKKRYELALRNTLADMAMEVQGESLLRLQQLYKIMNFLKSDVGFLSSKSSNKRLRSINRLEKLKLEIPFDLNINLLEDADTTIRMLAMVLLIYHHKKIASPYIISFIQQKKFEKKGHLFYILQELGKFDRRAISFLFERISGEDFEEALLISANISPPIHFDEVIYRKLTPKSAPFVIVWSLRVLMNYPSDKLLQLCKVLRKHPFWAVRLQVTKVLYLFEGSFAKEFIDLFLKDSNYMVRLEIGKLLIKNHTLYKEQILMLKADKEHLSGSIIRYLLAIDEHVDQSLITQSESKKIIPIKKAA